MENFNCLDLLWFMFFLCISCSVIVVEDIVRLILLMIVVCYKKLVSINNFVSIVVFNSI